MAIWRGSVFRQRGIAYSPAMRGYARQAVMVLVNVVLAALLFLLLFGNLIASLFGFGAPVE